MSMTKPHTPPTRYMVRVVVSENQGDDSPVIHDKVGDHGDSYFRDWIINTVWWAMRNDKHVEMIPQG